MSLSCSNGESGTVLTSAARTAEQQQFAAHEVTQTIIFTVIIHVCVLFVVSFNSKAHEFSGGSKQVFPKCTKAACDFHSTKT